MAGGPDFLDELKRRRVPRVALVYLATGFAMLEAADLIAPRLLLPDWTVTLLLVIAVLGFPVALVLAWAFDVSGGGIRRTVEQDATSSSSDDVVTARSGAQPTPWLGRRTLMVAGVFVLLGAGMSAGWFLRPAADAPAADASIAALPFETMSDDREDAWFADGVHEEILTQLSKLAGLRVISRTSVMGYRDQTKNIATIAGELGVRYILEGSVRRFGNTVKVTAQLIDSRDDSHIWSEIYERERNDLFEIQADVARHIAAALNTRISPQEAALLAARPTDDAEAHDLYLRGLQAARRYDSASELRRAIELFRQASARDPSFAEAHAEEANTHFMSWAFFYDRTPERLESARAAAERALRIRRDVVRAYEVLAKFHLRQSHVDSALAYVRFIERARPAAPEVPELLGEIEKQRGAWADAEASTRRALTLDPRNPDAWISLGVFLMDRGRLAEARASFEQALSLDSTSVTAVTLRGAMIAQLTGDMQPLRAALSGEGNPFGLKLVYMWWAAHVERDYAEAIRLAETARADRIDFGGIWSPLSFAATSRLAAGDTAGARRNFAALRDRVDDWLRATPDDPRLHLLQASAHAQLGNRDAALGAVQRALDSPLAATDAGFRAFALVTLSEVQHLVGDTGAAVETLGRFLATNGGWGQDWSLSWLARDTAAQRTPRVAALLRQYPPESLPRPVAQ